MSGAAASGAWAGAAWCPGCSDTNSARQRLERRGRVFAYVGLPQDAAPARGDWRPPRLAGAASPWVGHRQRRLAPGQPASHAPAPPRVSVHACSIPPSPCSLLVPCLRVRARGHRPARPPARCSVPPLALDLLERLLTFSPHTRITAAQALKHPYFTQSDQPPVPAPETLVRDAARFHGGGLPLWAGFLASGAGGGGVRARTERTRDEWGCGWWRPPSLRLRRAHTRAATSNHAQPPGSRTS